MINIRPNAVNLYTQRKRWKWLLIILGVMIVIISLWYTNIMVKNIASEERKKVNTWYFFLSLGLCGKKTYPKGRFHFSKPSKALL